MISIDLVAQRSRRASGHLYVFALPISRVPDFVPVPEVGRRSEGNRLLDVRHAREFGAYWKQQAKWAVPPLLLDTSEDLGQWFRQTLRAGGLEAGVLRLPCPAVSGLQILDGQHRVFGWAEVRASLDEQTCLLVEQLQSASTQGDAHAIAVARDGIISLNRLQRRLEDEQVTIEVLDRVDAHEHKQWFFDIAANAKGITKSLTAAFDRRSAINRATVRLADEYSLLEGMVEREAARVGPRAAELLSIAQLVTITETSVLGIDNWVRSNFADALEEDAVYDVAASALDTLFDGFDSLRAVAEGTDGANAVRLRERSLLGSLTMLRVLVGLFHKVAVTVNHRKYVVDDDAADHFTDFLRDIAADMDGTVPDALWASGAYETRLSRSPRARRQEIKGLFDALWRMWVAFDVRNRESMPEAREPDHAVDISEIAGLSPEFRHPALRALVEGAGSSRVVAPQALRSACESVGVEDVRRLRAVLDALLAYGFKVEETASVVDRPSTGSVAPRRPVAVQLEYEFPRHEPVRQADEPDAEAAVMKAERPDDADLKAKVDDQLTGVDLDAPCGQQLDEGATEDDMTVVAESAPAADIEAESESSEIEEAADSSSTSVAMGYEFVLVDSDTGDEPEQVLTNVRAPANKPFANYMREIGRYPLLSAEQEIDIARRIEAGLYADHRLGRRPFGPDWDKTKAGPDECRLYRELRWLVHDGQRAKETMIHSNLRLVVSIAKRFAMKELPFLDVIQEGNIGLIHAVDMFDYVKGFKFSTYATWWIRQSITRAIANQGRTIRLPVHVVERLDVLRRARRELLQSLDEVTVEDLSKATEIDEDEAKQILDWSRPVTSLDMLVPADSSWPLAEWNGREHVVPLAHLIRDDMEIDLAEGWVASAMLREHMDRVLWSLPGNRERQIIALRFGLDGFGPRTLDDIGKVYGVTRERIRQLQNKALARLAHPTRSHAFVEYIDGLTVEEAPSEQFLLIVSAFRNEVDVKSEAMAPKLAAIARREREKAAAAEREAEKETAQTCDPKTDVTRRGPRSGAAVPGHAGRAARSPGRRSGEVREVTESPADGSTHGDERR